MADFLTCYNWMMDNEDSQRKCEIVPDAGGNAISGINSHSFPIDYTKIAAMPQAERGLAVQAFYQTNFWKYSALTTNDVAKRVFDAAVNMGAGTAAKLLQIAVNSLVAPPIAEDGGFGPATIVAANKPAPSALVAAFIDARVAHYEAIAKAKPETAKFLQQWTARAKK